MLQNSNSDCTSRLKTQSFNSDPPETAPAWFQQSTVDNSEYKTKDTTQTQLRTEAKPQRQLTRTYISEHAKVSNSSIN